MGGGACEDAALPEVAAVVERLGFGRAQWFLAVVGGGVWLADGAELLLIGSVTRAVNSEWDLNAMQRGLMVSIVFVGVLLGNLLSGSIGDTMGRRLPIVLSYVGVFVSSLLSVLAWDFYSMILIRMFVGISFGVGQPAWNALGGEVVPAERRIHMNGLGQMLFSAGEIYSAVLIWSEDPRMVHLNWRWLIAMAAIPSLLLACVAFFFLPESPSYLALHGRGKEATRILERLRQANGISETVSVEFQPPRPAPAAMSNAYSAGEKLGVVFGRSLAVSTLITCFSTYTLNFLFYGGLYAFPQVLPDFDMGVSPAMSLILGAFMEVPGFVFGVLVGIQLSRKMGIQFYLVCTCLSTLLFAGAAHYARSYAGRLPTLIEVALQTGLIGNKVFTSVGFLIVYLYSVEIFPTLARTTGTALCLAAGRLGAVTCPLIYENFAEVFGRKVYFFYLMAMMCALNLLLVFCLPYETKGSLLRDHLDDETTPIVTPAVRSV